MGWLLAAKIWWSFVWRTLATSIVLLTILFFVNKAIGGSDLIEHASRVLPMIVGAAVQIWALKNAILRNRAKIADWFASIDQKNSGEC